MSSLRDRHAGKVAYATLTAAKEAGHGRIAPATDDERDSSPRVPIIGLDSGAIPGTKPQPGCSGAYLDRCARDIVRGHLRRHRRKDHKSA